MRNWGWYGRARAAVAGVLLVLAGVAGGCGPIALELPGATPRPGAGGVPGFDTRDYPGREIMQGWWRESPYRWVGYYLESPCHPRNTWMGRRAEIRAIGWGIALLYVGEQDWSQISAVPRGPGADPEGAPRCTQENLTPQHAADHGAEADLLAAAEGFPAGTVVYLNVERVERVSPELAAYVGAWTAALLERGRYVPGVYAHGRNAQELTAIMQAEFQRRGISGAPPLWVASSAGFDLARWPADSGFPNAVIWQGVFNTRETYGGASLLIDVNVAVNQTPSQLPAPGEMER
jgi:hypothetical protein